MSRLLLTFGIVCSFTGIRVFAAESAGDLTIRARAILKSHCAECHNGQKDSRSTLAILDHAMLISADRTLPPFVKPKGAAESQIMELIEDGSMPPGNRPKLSADEAAILRAWIAAGALGFPSKFDESYVLAHIVRDLAGPFAPGVDRKNFRYFSLQHLLEGDAALTELAGPRDEFRKALNRTGLKEYASLLSIDPAETVFRIDLRDTGWNATPFRLIDREMKDLPSLVNVFDLILLEYPYGEMPPRSQDANEIAKLWLRPIEQARPLIYLRADWFSRVTADTPLAFDLRQLVGAGAKGRGTAPDRKAARSQLGDFPDVRIPAIAKVTPILPIDGWYINDVEAKEGPKLEIKITNGAGLLATKFKEGDRMKMEIASNETVYVELIQIHPDNTVSAHDLGLKARVQAGVPKEVQFEGKPAGLLLENGKGSHRFFVYAAKEPIAPGDLVECANVEPAIDRFIHRVDILPVALGDPPRSPSAKIVRKAAVITVE